MGTVLSFINQSFPPESKFTVDSIPDLTGKVIIVMGTNGGIGYETAKVQIMLIKLCYYGTNNSTGSSVTQRKKYTLSQEILRNHMWPLTN